MTTKDTTLPLQPDDDALEWLRGRTVEELHAIEHQEPDSPIPTLLFPEGIRYRDGKGQVQEFATLLKIPRDDDHVTGTINAVAWVAKKYDDKTCKTPARAKELLGSEGYFAHLERCATLCVVLRNPKNPALPAFLLDVFVKTFEAPSVRDIWERAEILSRIFNPRLGAITEAQFWALASEVARVKNASPLFVLASATLESFITRLAEEVITSRKLKSSWPSSTGSMQA